MNNLLHFIYRYRALWVLVLLVVLSCTMLVRRHSYKRHVYLTSASAVAGGIHEAGSAVSGYFTLQRVNDELQARNAQLETQLLALRRQLDDLTMPDDTLVGQSGYLPGGYHLVTARVINNSIAHPHNYITLNRGASSGIEPEMGVVCPGGVVGIVNVVTDGYARVISLLNPDFRLSCKVKGSDAFGSLVWDGMSPRTALLEELPRHTIFAPGDTIVTSGYSAVFPEGIPVGTVLESASAADDNFYTLKVQLLTDFTTLNTVTVIASDERRAIVDLEQSSSR